LTGLSTPRARLNRINVPAKTWIQSLITIKDSLAA
jgi:hypothetical protein